MSDTRTILVILNNGKRRLIEGIPSDAKITYGPVSPGNSYRGENALRIYTRKDDQLAVFTGVQEFRDLSLTIKEEKVTRRRKSEEKRDGKGHSAVAEDEEIREWDDQGVF